MITAEERRIILSALTEDTAAGDPTTAATIDPSRMGSAVFMAKAEGILSGMEAACETFSIFAESTSRAESVFSKDLSPEGTAVKKGDILAHISAPLDILLIAERVALNFLQRMSGIATLTRAYVDACKGTKATIIDTRKTAPLLRPFDRQAVRAGGGTNNRYSLGDMVLVKDNHIAANDMDIALVIEKLRRYFETRERIPVELEVTSLEQFTIVKEKGIGIIDRVMFDNFPLEMLKKGVEMNAGTFQTEASGGVNLSTVGSIAQTGVDFISVGALTHSVTGLDISLEIEL